MGTVMILKQPLQGLSSAQLSALAEQWQLLLLLHQQQLQQQQGQHRRHCCWHPLLCLCQCWLCLQRCPWPCQRGNVR